MCQIASNWKQKTQKRDFQLVFNLVRKCRCTFLSHLHFFISLSVELSNSLTQNRLHIKHVVRFDFTMEQSCSKLPMFLAIIQIMTSGTERETIFPFSVQMVWSGDTNVDTRIHSSGQEKEPWFPYCPYGFPTNCEYSSAFSYHVSPCVHGIK